LEAGEAAAAEEEEAAEAVEERERVNQGSSARGIVLT